MRRALVIWLAAVACAVWLPGCGAGPVPESAQPPPATSPSGTGIRTGFESVVTGSADSVGATVGSPGAMYVYRFKQIDPGSDRFTFQDRDLSFYFRPTPDALHFQVENRQDRPVWIDWDRCTFLDPLGDTGKVAHATSTWRDRYGVQPRTQIPGLQRYSDYMFPVEYLLDPAGSPQQIHRPLFPEDASAPQYSDRTFGVDLVFLVEDRPRTYSFRFRVESVTPR